MTRGKAITLAVFTVWPFVYMILFMCTVIGLMLSEALSGGRNTGPPAVLLIIFPLHFLTMVEICALIAVYVIHLFKTDRIAPDKKALWAVVLFLGNILAMPVYWYMYIWREPQPRPPVQAPPQVG